MLTYPHFTPHFARENWTLPHVLEHQAATRPDAPFLSWTDAGEPTSFARTNATANRIAHGLMALGLKKGDHIALYLPNSAEFVFTWFGIQKMGGVEVALADSYKGSFLQHPLNLSDARVIVTNPALAHRIAEIEDQLPKLTHVIYLDDPEEPGATPPLFKRLTTSLWPDLLSDNEANPGVRITPRDKAAILFTSGTTGPSKAVLMPHSQFYFFAEEDVQLVRLKSDDVYMTGFPLIHGNAQFLTVYPCLIAGAHCVLYRKFSASDYIGRVKRSGCTVTNLLGATMSFICAQPVQPGESDHKLRRIYAAPLSRDLAGVFTERFGVKEYVDGFGQTEISNIFMTPPDAPRPEGACGVLVDQWFEARLVDPETGEDVPEGSVGELWVRNKAIGIMSDEYYGMPDKTVETWRYLWFKTGDGLKRDANGWYYFVDRVKDALRRRGENISSYEVEAVVREHPAVAECAVIAAQADEKAGEDEVMAIIVPNEGAKIVYEEIIAWCDERMPYFMVPRFLEVMDKLPQTPSEKVKKKELRERGITDTTWDRLKAGVKLKSENKPRQGEKAGA